MANCFSKSTCHQTKVVLKKGDQIYYVKSSDDPAIKDHRAYSPDSQAAAWLKIHGTLIPHEVKPAKVKAPVVAQTVPVMASMIHDEHPAPLASKKPRAIVMKSEAGTVVFYPAR
jgi:hypothetical protein